MEEGGRGKTKEREDEAEGGWEMCRVRRPLQLAFKMQEGGHKAGM